MLAAALLAATAARGETGVVNGRRKEDAHAGPEVIQAGGSVLLLLPHRCNVGGVWHALRKVLTFLAESRARGVVRNLVK